MVNKKMGFFLLMKYIYGPLKSRRLGLSLGISLTPYKICSFDCVYCQLGITNTLSNERKEYIAVNDVLAELKHWLQSHPQEAGNLDYITFSGTGEPTLHSKLGQLIASIKQISPVPIAVITNASLFYDPLVRQEVRDADLIVPSLDAVDEEAFLKIDRPAHGIKLKSIIEGLVALRKEFKKKMWLEVMLVNGINDDLAHIRKLKEVVAKIKPDKIQLNSPVRTPAECGVVGVNKERLQQIKEILGPSCEIV